LFSHSVYLQVTLICSPLDNQLNKSKQEVISEWVMSFSDRLYSRALFQTKSVVAAEDIVQDTFLAAFQGFEKFDKRSKPDTWLFAILNNKIIDHHRKMSKSASIDSVSGLKAERTESDFFNEHGEWRKETVPLEWHDSDEQVLDNPEFVEVLTNCLGKLPATWHSAVLMKYMDGTNPEIICQELEITSSNYWQVLHRAKLQLRKCIEVNWFNSDRI